MDGNELIIKQHQEDVDSDMEELESMSIPTKEVPFKKRSSVSKKFIGLEPQKKKIRCTVEGCNYSTSTRTDITRHMRKHTGETPFTCDICSKSFSRYDKLYCHIKIHLGRKDYQCPDCDHRSIDPSSLRKHQRIHAEKSFKCQLCPYKARDQSQLVVHLRSHTGDSPYICNAENCKAAFKTSSDLNRHRRTHTGDKPYPCSLCEYRATVKSNLNAHIRKHHSSKGAPKSTESTASPSPSTTSPAEQLTSIESPSPQNETEVVLPFQLACKSCPFKSDTIQSFELHMKESHNTSFKSTQAKNTLFASDKGLKGEFRTKAKREEDKHEFSKYFKCNLCPASFVRDDSLRCHIRQHRHKNPTFIPGHTSKAKIEHHPNKSSFGQFRVIVENSSIVNPNYTAPTNQLDNYSELNQDPITQQSSHSLNYNQDVQHLQPVQFGHQEPLPEIRDQLDQMSYLNPTGDEDAYANAINSQFQGVIVENNSIQNNNRNFIYYEPQDF